MTINTPNVDNINKVISLIKGEEGTRFLMCDWVSNNNGHNSHGHWCNTAACIAGFAAIAMTGDVGSAYTLYDTGEIEDKTMDYLGLNNNAMFLGRDDKQSIAGVVIHYIKASDAVKVLEQFRDTGTYSWRFHPNYEKFG